MAKPAPMDVFLLPGEFFVGDEGYQIRTILGSCVSITLWHPAARVGGMSHFVLPTRGTGVLGNPADLDGHYGDEALALMMNELKALGVAPTQCQAKVFGGGHMFPGRVKMGPDHVGMRNGEAALAMLSKVGIPVLGECLYGYGHRQIIFDISKGDVWSRQVKPSLMEQAAEAEAQRWMT
ncbi:MAG: chemotaxis protein CheD [Burkholderiaceae bacterium]|nr:chemotaxis protein CheD [Burkholderiaceae bacterium]